MRTSRIAVTAALVVLLGAALAQLPRTGSTTTLLAIIAMTLVTGGAIAVATASRLRTVPAR